MRRPADLPGASSWIHADVRNVLGAFGQYAEVFNVYSAGDSGDGCEVIEFTTPSPRGRAAWTAKVVVCDGRRCVICTSGWTA